MGTYKGGRQLSSNKPYFDFILSLNAEDRQSPFFRVFFNLAVAVALQAVALPRRQRHRY